MSGRGTIAPTRPRVTPASTSRLTRHTRAPLMTPPCWTLRVVAAAALALVLPPLTTDIAAQGVTTGAVAGTVTDRTGRPIEGAQVQVQNRTTGYSTGALSRANGY